MQIPSSITSTATEDVLHEERYSIPQRIIQKLHESVSRIQTVLQANGGPTPYYQRSLCLSQLFSLLCLAADAEFLSLCPMIS